jgi:1-acyl-sn-glycerol-3-phosphate acyltransferase
MARPLFVFRSLRVALHIAAGLAICAGLFPLMDEAGRLRRIQRWSHRLLVICGVRIDLRDVHGVPSAAHAMIIANHISWLDVFVINAIAPSRFVAKADIRQWPILGWLSHKAGTVYISRGNRRDVRRIFEGLAESLHAGEQVAFFPEGTTARQGNLLPFHANLFEAAIDATVPIQPYALRYLDGAGGYHPAVEFFGDKTFAGSLATILRSGAITVQVLQLAPISTDGALRRPLAETARTAILDALGLISPPSHPAPDIADTPPETAPGPQAAPP